MGVTRQDEVIWGGGLGLRLVPEQKDANRRWGASSFRGAQCGETPAKVLSEFRLVQGALCWVKAVINSVKGRAEEG